jgi:hypothetical protein
MGLLDIWSDWKKDNQSQSNGFEDYTSTNGGTLDTAGGGQPTNPINTMLNRKDQKPTGQFDFNPLKEGKTNLPQWMLSDQAKKNQAALIQQQGTPKGEMMPADNEEPSTQISGAELSKDSGFMSKLANMAGVDMKQAGANWKDKGGFEGLMSNPAFSLGLALMQSSANGKTINQGILDNFVKSAKISSEFKDRIEARSGDVIEATEGQMNQIKSVLKTKGMDKPGWWRKILPGNQSEGYEQAVEDITMKIQQKVNKMKRDAKASGKSIVVGNRLYKKIIDDMIASGEINKKGGVKAGGYQIIDSTLEAKAKGGPIQEGKPYLVGEKGPEIIIPHSSGNVLSNDDSQIYAMLLASNPQLQKVSRQRAEKVLRNRFPEYFEG